MDKRKSQSGNGAQGATGGGRWTEGQWRQAVGAWQGSGLSASKFALRHGLNPKRLYWWRKRLGDWASCESSQSGLLSTVSLVPAEVHTADISSGAARAVVRLRCGVVVEFGDAALVTPRWIASLVDELSRLS